MKNIIATTLLAAGLCTTSANASQVACNSNYLQSPKSSCYKLSTSACEDWYMDLEGTPTNCKITGGNPDDYCGYGDACV